MQLEKGTKGKKKKTTALSHSPEAMAVNSFYYSGYFYTTK